MDFGKIAKQFRILLLVSGMLAGLFTMMIAILGFIGEGLMAEIEGDLSKLSAGLLISIFTMAVSALMGGGDLNEILRESD